MVNNTWVLIYKKLNNTATPEELVEIDQILKEDGGGQYPIAMLEHLWKVYPIAGAPENEPSEQQWSFLQSQLKKTSAAPPLPPADTQFTGETKSSWKRHSFKYLLSAAAVGILICSSLVLIYLKPAVSKNGICEIKVPMGGMTNVQLPDGSTIILNAGSKLTYKNTFDARHREITLSGEAFFDVVKDPAHPFVVITPTIKIRVLGTRFNVRSYPGDKTSEASLLRGIIELTVLKNPDRQIILKPSEKLTVINSPAAKAKATSTMSSDTTSKPIVELSGIHQNGRDSLPSEAVWIRNKIIFDGTEFEEVAKMMERKYNTKIIFKRDELKSVILTGKFENITLDKALQQLKLIGNFNYQIINNQVFIY
jgi:transmembrane sensor